MSRLVTILRAAHCRSTHHYFAIDALAKIETVQGKRLADLLLKHHDEYLVGAKAPDSTFRDFRNHVLHVSDNHWGGAIKACEDWAQKALLLLDQGRWKKAAYACGVLSHYFTDPLMPLHTGQSEKESTVHRPMEWSICKSYEAIYELSKNTSIADFELTSHDDWIGRAVLKGAGIAHGQYDQLIDLYDLRNGCKTPPLGLNAESRDIVAGLFSLAIGGWAKVLSKLADDTTSELPEVSHSLTSFLATIDMPLAWIVRNISDIGERRAVKKIFREIEATGTLRRNLPTEIKVVREQRRKDWETPRKGTSKTQSHLFTSDADFETPMIALPKRKVPSASKEQERDSLQPIPSNDIGEAGRVNLDSKLVDAPSIGPKTARRFGKIGITTIRQFVSAECQTLADQLATHWISLDMLRDWQDQAKLVCDVPALCGYKAQLLVAVGCRSRSQLRRANAYDLGEQIASFCATSEGRRILRSSSLPNKDDIAEWISSATTSQQRAA